MVQTNLVDSTVGRFLGFLLREKNENCSENVSAGVDGGLSEGSSVRRPGSEDPHLRQRKFSLILLEWVKPILLQNIK